MQISQGVPVTGGEIRVSGMSKVNISGSGALTGTTAGTDLYTNSTGSTVYLVFASLSVGNFSGGETTLNIVDASNVTQNVVLDIKQGLTAAGAAGEFRVTNLFLSNNVYFEIANGHKIRVVTANDNNLTSGRYHYAITTTEP